ncbi:MAG: hypothetical protein ACYDDT_08480, partial [Sulfuricella sp.]
TVCSPSWRPKPWEKRFRFKNKRVSLDSTVIDLCMSMYDWAKFRRTKGAVKLHLVLDHDSYLTRMKDKAQFEVVETREPPQNRNILKDQTIPTNPPISRLDTNTAWKTPACSIW